MGKYFDKFLRSTWTPMARDTVHEINEFTRFLDTQEPSNISVLYQSSHIEHMKDQLVYLHDELVQMQAQLGLLSAPLGDQENVSTVVDRPLGESSPGETGVQPST